MFMKVALWICGIVVALAAIYIGALLLIGGDVVTSNYATLSEARAEGPVAHGWLPDILPPSARQILTKNNLDLNTSVGEFRFASVDYHAFAAHLRPYSSHSVPCLDGYVEKMQARSYQSGVFSAETSTWLFVCKPKDGYCEYMMWQERE